jgi:hypothetical protein
MHYTDLPEEFLKLRSTFAEKKTFIFDGIHYLHVFIYLMTKRYDKLADNLVNIDGTFSSREEAIALMKERARKITLPQQEPDDVKLFINHRKVAERVS